eukprot:SAG31_NODE_2618_length_5366_cov_2.137650_2_plen_174_part_00
MLAGWPEVGSAESILETLNSGGLTAEAANSMIENVVGTICEPAGCRALCHRDSQTISLSVCLMVLNVGLSFTAALPLGLGLNFVINGVPIKAIPMAVEEPSVVAACSGGAISFFGGSNVAVSRLARADSRISCCSCQAGGGEFTRWPRLSRGGTSQCDDRPDTATRIHSAWHE